MEYNLNNKDAFAALKNPDFRKFVTARFFLTFAIQMQSVIIGWQIYQLTHDALSLGLVGMFEAVPFIAVALFAGHLADRISRKKIILYANTVYFICAAGLLAISTDLHPLLAGFGTTPIYFIIFITGLARGFLSPAQSAFSAQLIPKHLFGNASTWSSIVWEVATVTGPAIGGLIYGFLGVGYAYSTVIFSSALGLMFFSFVSKKPVAARQENESIFESLKTGLRFVFKNDIILGAISLDMFAVFFGGAVAVLPIFADEILHTGAEGLGFLRAAPAVGAIIMSLWQAYHPPFAHAGRNLLTAVAGFGITIIVFALSQNFYATLFVLMLGGMLDNVSVIIRATIIQVYTPDEMRGRVSSVNGIFIGSSNELGSFESGLAAKLMGLVPSVVFGGSMTLAVVAGMRKIAPNLRKLRMS